MGVLLTGFEIQAMLGLLAEKFIKGSDELKRMKELMSVGDILIVVRNAIKRLMPILGINLKLCKINDLPYLF